MRRAGETGATRRAERPLGQPILQLATLLAFGAGLMLAPGPAARAGFFDDVLEGAKDVVEDTSEYIEEKVGGEAKEGVDEVFEGEEAQQPSMQPQGTQPQAAQPQSAAPAQPTVSQPAATTSGGQGAMDPTSEAQSHLNNLGYNAGPVDGQAGIKTAMAIAAFQKDHGMAQDGKITPILVEALRAADGGGPAAAQPPVQATGSPASPPAFVTAGLQSDLGLLVGGMAQTALAMDACGKNGKAIARDDLISFLSQEWPDAISWSQQQYEKEYETYSTFSLMCVPAAEEQHQQRNAVQKAEIVRKLHDAAAQSAAAQAQPASVSPTAPVGEKLMSSASELGRVLGEAGAMIDGCETPAAGGKALARQELETFLQTHVPVALPQAQSSFDYGYQGRLKLFETVPEAMHCNISRDQHLHSPDVKSRKDTVLHLLNQQS